METPARGRRDKVPMSAARPMSTSLMEKSVGNDGDGDGDEAEACCGGESFGDGDDIEVLREVCCCCWCCCCCCCEILRLLLLYRLHKRMSAASAISSPRPKQ